MVDVFDPPVFEVDDVRVVQSSCLEGSSFIGFPDLLVDFDDIITTCEQFGLRTPVLDSSVKFSGVSLTFPLDLVNDNPLINFPTYWAGIAAEDGSDLNDVESYTFLDKTTRPSGEPNQDFLRTGVGEFPWFTNVPNDNFGGCIRLEPDGLRVNVCNQEEADAIVNPPNPVFFARSLICETFCEILPETGFLEDELPNLRSRCVAEESRFVVFPEEQIEGDKLEEFCQQVGGFAPIIDSPEKFEIVMRDITAPLSEKGPSSIWVGIQGLVGGSALPEDFVFQRGSEDANLAFIQSVQAGFEPWADNRPSGGLNEAPCVDMFFDATDRGFRDVPCQQSGAPMCEFSCTFELALENNGNDSLKSVLLILMILDVLLLLFAVPTERMKSRDFNKINKHTFYFLDKKKVEF